jgi:phosphoribosylformimino-5-aminoimidazole carboxamide ribotide isomerase
VARVEDIVAVRARAGAGIEGVIVGRALYDGRISPEEALRAARG